MFAFLLGNLYVIFKAILICKSYIVIPAKEKMSNKSVRSGGFGVPPTHILEAFAEREKFRDVIHWKRRHVFNVVFPNEPPASVFDNEDEAETLVKETAIYGKIINCGQKQGYKTVTLVHHFNRKVGRSTEGSDCFSVTVIKYVSTNPMDIITAFPS